MKLLDAGLDWVVGRFGDAASKPLAGQLSRRAARRELEQAASRATAVAIAIAPELSDSLSSGNFLKHVLAGSVRDAAHDPTRPLTADTLENRFVAWFVAPHLRGRDLGQTLREIYRLEPQRLRAAFVSLHGALRSELYQSRHWRAAVTEMAAEETRIDVARLTGTLAAPTILAVNLDEARQDARTASFDLRSWSNAIHGLHLDRPELAALRGRISASPSGTTLLVGQSGAGKSALLGQLTRDLEEAGLPVFAIKADLLPRDVANLDEVARALGIKGELVVEIGGLARIGPVVVIIDQLDAVSEVMDRSSQRMRLLLQLANQWRDDEGSGSRPQVHVVVSSRPFEASHDARFQSLQAETLTLGLPEYARVEQLLSELRLVPASVPAVLRETLRRPFMLKIYVDLATRGEPLAGLVEGSLLNAWLASAQFGSEAERREVFDLLALLAVDMTDTETLWRPADRFDADMPAAVHRAEACELIVRKSGCLGFSHQSWLDDFQARRLTTGQAVAEYAWQAQDGLFGRATILRALQRLRSVEPAAYIVALDRLLGEVTTRRHVRHLVIDLVASQTAPLPRECAWIQDLIVADPILARRAMSLISERWAGWRATMKPLIVGMARTPDMVMSALALSTAETAFDPNGGDELLVTVWADESLDFQAFDLCWRAPLWSPTVARRVGEIFERQPLGSQYVAHYVSELADHTKYQEAAELLGLFLSKTPDAAVPELHGLEKVADNAPLAFAKVVVPWLCDLLAAQADQSGDVSSFYPKAPGLPYDWREDDERGKLLGCLERALRLVAQTAPADFLSIIQPLIRLDVDEAQALVAEGFAAAPALLADEAFAWLISDPRRLQVGEAHLDDVNNVGHTIQGWSTRELFRALAPRLTPEHAAALVSAIESWHPYREYARDEGDPGKKRQILGWSEAARAPLLDLLPPGALTARRRRQVVEARADQPKLQIGRRRMIASVVGSPMTAGQMELASDDELFGMLDEVHDGADFASRRSFTRGGVSQLSDTFGAFGKDRPDRALSLVQERFLPARHEASAGALIRSLGQSGFDGERLLAQIRSLDARGFRSEHFRRDAAWAMEAVARRNEGLTDDDVQLLASWLVVDAEMIADRTARRREVDQHNLERNRTREPRAPQPILFGRGTGELTVVPQGNYTLLSAIACGLLFRKPAAHEAWRAVLTRHLPRPEDPTVWANLLMSHGWSLNWADPSRVQALFTRLHERRPEAFEPAVAGYLWQCRRIVPPSVRVAAVRSWLEDTEHHGPQLAGEYAMAASLIDPGDAAMRSLANELLAGPDRQGRLGAIFSTAAAWRVDDPDIRAAAHGILLPMASAAVGDIAAAVSHALSDDRALRADSLTRELLQAALTNRDLLEACLNGRFANALQELLLHPGFEALVMDVSERSADLLLAEGQRRVGFVGQEFVAIAVALQRSDGDLRLRAMNLYERLLDGGVYGADQAARASLQR
jgi:hypothetical protein